jgi:hypothetical protein
MSGGSWDYVYFKFEEVADRLAQEKDPLRKALSKRVRLLAKTMQAIEWVDSCDWEPPSDSDAIKEFLGTEAKELALSELIQEARDLIKRMEEFGA